MRISNLCIERPVLAWVLTLTLMLTGFVCFKQLPIQYFPKIEHPYVTIETQLPGASAEVVEQSVTRLIEESVSSIDGIVTVSSVSQMEESKVQIEFRADKNIEDAVNDVRDKVAKVKPDLPPDALQSVITRAASDTAAVLSIVLMGKDHELGALAEYARNEIEKELESVQGVSQVIITGSGHYRMHIYLDPIKLAANGITVTDVLLAVKKHNFEKPAGSIKTGDKEYVVTTVSTLDKPVQFENMAVSEKQGHVLRIKDIGHVEMSPEEKRTRSRFNGERVISILVQKQSTANPLSIANAIKYQKLPELQRKLRPGMELKIGSDSAYFISQSIYEVYKSIIEAVIFVTLVVFVFLQSFRASLIPLVTIPVSLIGSFFVMYLCGFTINVMTLMAMVLAIGLVVDDAIVVLENIHRHIKKNLSPLKAAYVGIQEIGFAVIAMTLTLAAVYAPISLAKGMTGKLLIEFAITLASAVIISGFCALTLSPMMCSRILLSHEDEQKESLMQKFKTYVPVEQWMNRLEDYYGWLLKQVLQRKLLLLLSVLVFAILCLGIYKFIPKTLWPKEDRGIIRIEGEAPQTSTIEFTDKHLKKLDDLLSDIPDIEKRQSTIENATNYKMNLTLKTKHRRPTNDVMKVIEKKFNEVTGINARINTSSETSESEFIHFALRGNKDVKQLVTYAQNVIFSAMMQTGLFTGLPLTTQRGEQEQYVIMVSPKVDALKVDPVTVAEAIEALIKGKKANSFRKEGRLYDVMVEKQTVESIDDITKIFIRTNERNKDVLIPLAELIDIQPKMGFPNINHIGRTRSVDQKYKMRLGVSMDDAIAKIKTIAAQHLPEDIFLDFIGETKKYMSESNMMLFIFTLSLCFIYLVMAAQFESWRDPFIILFSVPLSLAGAVIAIGLTKNPLITIYGNIGFVTLIGLITKHGILIVDFANKLQAEGMPMLDAIQQASRMRLRPILMTTCAMVLGVLPMALATGASSESRKELGLVIIGGLIVGTFLTLFVIPCVYTFVTKKKHTPSVTDTLLS